jgi:hypothetical protein
MTTIFYSTPHFFFEASFEKLYEVLEASLESKVAQVG